MAKIKAADIDWGRDGRARRRKPCTEDPENLKGQPIGQYSCPICGEMQIASAPHLPPEENYEDVFGKQWPSGYEEDAVFIYRNYKGVVALRRVENPKLHFAESTPHHPHAGYYLSGTCLDRKARRTFALKDVISWEPTVGEIAAYEFVGGG